MHLSARFSLVARFVSFDLVYATTWTTSKVNIDHRARRWQREEAREEEQCGVFFFLMYNTFDTEARERKRKEKKLRDDITSGIREREYNISGLLRDPGEKVQCSPLDFIRFNYTRFLVYGAESARLLCKSKTVFPLVDRWWAMLVALWRVHRATRQKKNKVRKSQRMQNFRETLAGTIAWLGIFIGVTLVKSIKFW